jgi:hypothetical protein
MPKAPNPDRLAAIRQTANHNNAVNEHTNAVGGRNNAINEAHNSDTSSASESEDEPVRGRAKRNSHKAHSAMLSNPKRFRFYPSQWRMVLDAAKWEFRLWMTEECGFPVPSDLEHRKIVGTCLTNQLFEFQQSGGRVEDGTSLDLYLLITDLFPRILPEV